MKAITAADGVEYVDCDNDFEEQYEDILGITWIKEEALTKIILAVKHSYVGYMDTKPIHGSQVKFPVERQTELHDKYAAFDCYTFYGLTLKPNRELYNTLYRYGNDVLLVSPSVIREKMIQELTASLEKNEKRRMRIMGS